MKERALLELREISRVFGGIRAVDGLDLAIQAGTVVSLIGPNGAGKTTVINLISGLLKPTGGSIWFDGVAIDGRPTYRVASLGLARTYQNIRLFRSLSALENVVVGQHARRPSLLAARLVFAAPHAASRPRRKSAPWRCSPKSVSPAKSELPHVRCPTATNGAWRSPALWPPVRGCCSSTSPPRACPFPRWSA